MPKIKNWSKRPHNAVPPGFVWVWDHNNTDETVAVTQKVEEDGYYVYHFSKGALVRQGNGTRIGYSHRKDYVRKQTTKKLKKNTEGYDR